MANHQVVHNTKNSINNQYNIINNYPQTSYRNTTVPVEFHFTEPTYSFTGRNDEIQEMRKLFFEDKNKIIIICGFAGYGKIELARKFVRQCKEDKKITQIFWMEADTADILMQSFKELAELFQLPKVDNRSLVQMVYKHIKSQLTDYMIVLDNAVNMKQIVPQFVSKDCMCLVTTQFKDWEDLPTLDLEPLSPDAAVDVLRVILGSSFKAEDAELYKKIAKIVSFVPLGLQVTAAYVRQEMRYLKKTFNLEDHFKHVSKSCEELINKSVPDSNTYDKTVAQAIQISLHRIENVNTNISKLACNVLHVAVYLYPGQIFHSDLLKISCIKKILENSENPDKDLIRACSYLSDYCFISNNNSKITIHRFIQYTVIYHQKHLENNNHLYMSCLELLLENTNNANRQFILQEKNTKIHSGTFKNFFSQHKAVITFKSHFLHNLIETGCKLYLSSIFDDLGDGAADIINKFCLLHHAVRFRQYDVIKLLLEYGGDVNQQNEFKDRAIFIAVDMLDLTAVKILTSNQSRIIISDANHSPILHTAVIESSRPGYSERSDVVFELLRLLVGCGASTELTNYGETLLHTAAIFLNTDLIHFLVNEFHQRVDALDNEGRTPLYHIIVNPRRQNKERLQMAECLLNFGASLDVVDNRGQTPIQYMRLQGYEYLAKYLENPSKKNVSNPN